MAVMLFALVSTKPVIGQNSSQEDEFLPVEQTSESTDEFEEFNEFEHASASDDEFGEFTEGVEVECSASCDGCAHASGSNEQLWWVLSILGVTIVAGFLVRLKSAVSLRGLFLITSLIVLGFYKGGCPCPIMSMQHVVLAGIGGEVKWTGMIWFLGLLPITYLFGKVWCGWICHLGALQEIIYLPGKVKILQSEKAQKRMRYIRIALFIALIGQIIYTQTNLFKVIDPFKVAFNLRAANTTGWVLLGLLILSSLFIYRPFCKAICPIGLVLGWISKIPGASILAPKKTCVGCKTCNNSCKINAITRDNKFSKLDNQECIACGECTADCKKDSIKFVRNTKEYASKTVCKVD